MADSASIGPKKSASINNNQRVAFAPVTNEFQDKRVRALAERRIGENTLTPLSEADHQRAVAALSNGTARAVSLPPSNGNHYSAVLMPNDAVYVVVTPKRPDNPAQWMRAGTLSKIMAFG